MFQIFVEGMYKYLNLGKEIIDRIFPCIEQLIDIHFRFLEELRIRQNEQPAMSTLADILLKQFSGRIPSHKEKKKHCRVLKNSLKMSRNCYFIQLLDIYASINMVY